MSEETLWRQVLAGGPEIAEQGVVALDLHLAPDQIGAGGQGAEHNDGVGSVLGLAVDDVGVERRVPVRSS